MYRTGNQMPNNTKVRSNAIAAKATKLISKVDFNHQRLHPTLLAALYDELIIVADCRRPTAVRHIKAALGLTDPVGRLKSPIPVQRFNYRATDEEAKVIKVELKEYVKEMLEELRND